MAKPPKKTSIATGTDTSTTKAVDPLTGNRGTSHSTDINLPGFDSASVSHSLNTSESVATHTSNVTVSVIPGTTSNIYGRAHSEIAWPSIRLNELVPTGDDTGLFTGPDQRTYAQIGTEGRFVVEQDLQGNYYVPLSFAPGVPGPVLTKIQGQASWRIERPGWHSAQSPTVVEATPQPQVFISPHLTDLLTKAELSPDAIRYDKHKRTYVDMAQGTVMVGKHEGSYRETSASALSPKGAEVERIPDTTLWRRKAQDRVIDESSSDNLRAGTDADESTPVQSKRPRLDDDNAPSPPTPVPEQTPYFWLPWGHLNPLPSVDSIQLGWLHYPIVPMGSAPQRLPKVFFLQHPDFAPARFDAFEQMLRTTPELQPVATFRIGNEPGEVRPGKRFFDKPLSQSVAETFPDFSDYTSQAVARKLFELSDNSPVITGTGLVNIQAVLHQWNQRPFPNAPAYADPMNMLPVAASIDVAGKKVIPLPAQVDGSLQRLTFDPQRFKVEWDHYKSHPTDLNLRRLMGALLIHSGYDLFPLTHEHRMPTLVFKRAPHDEVFFLKLGTVEHVGFSHTPGNELANPNLPDRIGNDAMQALTTAAAKNKVVWLIGGVLKVQSQPDSVIIIRER